MMNYHGSFLFYMLIPDTRKMKTNFYSLTILLLAISFSAKTQGLFNFETGAVFTGYNDIRIPGNQGTLFSFKDELTSKPAFFFRLRATYIINSRHTLSLLYAPLTTKAEGSVPRDVLFEGVNFPANTELEGTYKFNSYRLTYRYRIVNKPKFEFGLGFTAKIRDAKIALRSSSLESEKPNVGFVPIINFRLFWNIDEHFGLLLVGDALGSPQGRAEDVLVALTYKASDRFSLRAGYRILEGGADVDEVYNFSLFNYASVGATYTFLKNKDK